MSRKRPCDIVASTVVALAIMTNGQAWGGAGHVTADYGDSGRVLNSVQRPDGGQELAVGRPLWFVATEADGMISAVDFVPVGSKDGTAVFEHKQSGLACSVTSRASGTFIRHFYTLEATKPVMVKQFVGMVLPSEFSAGGTVPGSPLVHDDWFAGMEYPTARTLERMDSQIGVWSPSMFSPKVFKAVTYSVPDELVKTSDSLDVQFTYQGGPSRLDVRRVALMQGDKLIAEDIHDGFAGTPTSKSVYRLDLRSLSKDQRAGLKMVAEVMKALKETTGVDIPKMLTSRYGDKAPGSRPPPPTND